MKEVLPETAPYDFLLSLDDATRTLGDPAGIAATTAALLCRHLQADGCACAEVEPDQDRFKLTGHHGECAVAVLGSCRFSDFGIECLRLMRAGETCVIEDSEADPRTQEALSIYRQLRIRAAICVPLLKDGRLVTALVVHCKQPRSWQREDVYLVRLAVGRCWESSERARMAATLAKLREAVEREAQQRSEDLNRTDRQFAQLVAGVTDCAIYMVDTNGCIASWNTGAERIKGYSAEEIIGRHFSLFYTAEDRAGGLPERSLSLVAVDGKFEGEGWRVRKDGSRFWASVLIDPIYDTHGQLIGYAKLTRDMSERRLIQEQINQAQKMEAIGQLTGGVAHDFNNLLTVILGNLDTVQRRAPAGDARLQRALEHATRGAERAAALTHQLLAFSRRQPLNPKPTGVNHLVTTLLELIRRTMPESISVQSRLRGGVGQVNVDANQMESALLNLAVNARDAMSGQGMLTIETDLIDMSPDEALRMGDLRPGLHAVISVKDTGVGMSAEVMARAFDPFFTTKPTGQGTGLGLSQVFGFVKQSGGTVKLYSELGRGTTVKVYLPSVDADGVVLVTRSLAEEPRARNHETVLVVEDEDDVRSYSLECLQELGFSVLQAQDGPSALQLVATHPEISLLFTDVGLPQMNGRQLVEEVRRLRPELPVLFATGYAQDLMLQQGMLDPNAELLTKPFNRTQLAERVHSLLYA
jgi:PAS domain S-box-containing protein